MAPASQESPWAILTDQGAMMKHALNFLMCFIALWILDLVVLSPVAKARLTKPSDIKITRWFFVHGIANGFAVVTGANAFIAVMSDPHNALDSHIHSDVWGFFSTASAWPLTMVNAVHLYHCVGGFNLSAADWFHHIMFIPFLGVPGQILKSGAIEPAGTCFISGLPGGLTYILLCFCKLGMLHPMQEKRITANLNTWVRVPGILIHSFLVYQAILYGRHSLPLWPAWLHVLLPPYNALYYCKQSVANYTVHYMTQLLSQDKTVHKRIIDLSNTNEANLTSPTARAVHVSWKEAIQTPQRGC
jgi:hypothetical protein